MGEPVKCPTCKDDDCVESVRHDNCTACGWTQYVPLVSPAVQTQGVKKCECICHKDHECKCGTWVETSDSQPPPSDVEEKKYCEYCKGICYSGKPNDANSKHCIKIKSSDDVPERLKNLEKYHLQDLPSSYHYELKEILMELLNRQ